MSVGRCEVRKERKKKVLNDNLEKRLDFFSPCAWNCLMRHLGLSGVAGILASAGTPLLDYKRGVPVARRPH
jgi:hypothetical protein